MTMSEHEPDHLSGPEIGKDVIQATAEAAASAVGEVAVIITRAVRDVATAIGDFATEVFEIREAAQGGPGRLTTLTRQKLSGGSTTRSPIRQVRRVTWKARTSIRPPSAFDALAAHCDGGVLVGGRR